MPLTSRRDRSTLLSPVLRAAVAVLGIGSFAAGVAAVFVTENGTGAAALLAIGAGFLVLAVLGDRVQSLEMGGVNLTIRDLARDTFALAQEAERRGDEESAARLRAVGDQLQALARGYRRLRRTMRAGSERTQALTHVVREARALASSDVLKREDVVTWFEEGTPEARITALGLMQGNPSLRDFEAMLDAISDPRSHFERYHGLRLAEMMAPDLGSAQRAQLVVTVEHALRTFSARRDKDIQVIGKRVITGIKTA